MIKKGKKKKILEKREFMQFNEWISRMYPELHKLRSGKDRISGKLDTLTRSFTFQVTDKCNLACTYCYQINKSTRRMKLEDAKLAVDKLLSGADGFHDYINPEKSPGIVLEFIGGEPFLEIELIDQIVDYFREQAILLNHPWANKFCISICSNGVLYTDERVQKFLQKNNGVISFSVTVDGVQELHDKCRIFPDGRPSYHLAHGAAMDWMSRGYYMGSKITISPENITYVAESLEQMIQDGYTDINANFVYEEGWELKHATECYKQIKMFTDKTLMDFDMNDYAISFLTNNGEPMPCTDNKNWCGGTGDMLSMDPDGYLYPCIRYMESSLGNERQPLRIGNIHTGLLQKPDEKKCIDCMNAITRRSQSTDECWYCPVAQGCGWCSGYNYQTFGTVNKRTTFTCIMHKARSLATAYYTNKHIASGDSGTPKNVYLSEDEAVEIIGKEQYDELVAITEAVGGKINKTGKHQTFVYKVNDKGFESTKFFDISNKKELAQVIEEEKKLIQEETDNMDAFVADAKEKFEKLKESRSKLL